MLKYLNIISIFAVIYLACPIKNYAQISPSGLTKLNSIPKNLVINLENNKIPFKSLIQKSKAAVIVFFNPDCDHCQMEIKEITKQMNELMEIQFILVSNRPINLLEPFAKQYNLSKYKNIKVVCSFDNAIFKFYGIGSFPSMVIYNSKNKVTQKFENSLVAIADIIKFSKQ